MSWIQYINKTKSLNPHKLLVEALNEVSVYENALDFGAGGLRDTKLLIQKFRVVDVLDSEALVNELVEILKSEHVCKINFINSLFHNFNPDKQYNLINAQYSLPFVFKKYEKEVIRKLVDSLSPKGIFTGVFFGLLDDWNDGKSKIIFHNLNEVELLLNGLKIISIKENKYTEKKSQEAKNWHVYEFIAKKN